MRKLKEFFSRLRNKNIVFVLSFVFCAGIISLIALISDAKNGNIEVSEPESVSAFATITWYKAGPDAYELDSEIYDLNASAVVNGTTQKTITAKASTKTKKTSAAVKNTKKTNTTVKSNKDRKTAVTTTSVKSKKTTVKTVKTTAKTKKKKKTVATTASTTAYSPSKALAGTYKTRDISDETYKIKNSLTGKKVKSDGFDIVCQIVNGEVGSSWSDEALKAQAVAAYTYLRYCEASGMTAKLAAKSGYGDKIKNAVKSVEGLICTYNGSVINAVFCASTAGCTADSQNVWGSSQPYLKSVNSKYDSTYDPNYGVTKVISKSDVKTKLENQGITLSNKPSNWIKVLSNYNGKYVGNVSIDGKKTLTGAQICSIMGLKSAAFTVKYSDGSFTFTTYGYGHGVGMSQWGAHFYASIGGYKFDQILKHYYSGIKISAK